MEERAHLKNFVVGGGGTWGYAYIGAIEGLFKSNHYNMDDYKNIKNYVGCSVGSIISAMMACGASIEELQILIGEVDPSKAQDDSWGFLRDLYRLYYYFGYYKGEYMENTIRKIINTLFENDFKKNGSKIGDKRDHYTFTDIYNQFGKNLIVNGVNVNTRETVYFNKLTHPNMEVAIACRISSGLPLIFKAYKYEEDYYIDGGIIDTYPIRYCTTRIFEMIDSGLEYTEQEINKARDETEDLIRDKTNTDEIMKSTIGIKGYDNRTYNYIVNGKSKRIEKFTLFTFIKEIMEMLSDLGSRHYIDSYLWKRTIKLNMGNESVADFDLTDEDKEKLRQIGINSSNKFIDKVFVINVEPNLNDLNNNIDENGGVSESKND